MIIERPHNPNFLFGASIVFGLAIFMSQPQLALGQQWTTNGNDIINANSGNVGIKNPAPAVPLDIKADNVPWGGQVRIAAPDFAQITFYNSNNLTLGGAGRKGTIYYDFPNSQLFLGSSGSLVLAPAGNVGIGTTTPGTKLDVGVGLPPRGANSDVLIGAGGNNAQIELYGPTKSVALANDETLGGLVLYTNGPVLNAAIFAGNSGNVGVGTTVPAYKLDVAGVINSHTANFYSPTDNWGVTIGRRSAPASGVAVHIAANTATGYGLIQGYNYALGPVPLVLQLDGGNVGIGSVSPNEKLEVSGNIKVSGTGNIDASGTITGGNIAAKYQDVAEWVPASHALSVGTVVTLDSTKSNHVEASSQAYDTRVAGVISSQPGIALGEAGENKVLVATTGRVRIKVDASQGPIQVGDLLVTSDIPGVAMKSQPINVGGVQIHRPGTLIGKALEPLAKGRGEILVLLSLQ